LRLGGAGGEEVPVDHLEQPRPERRCGFLGELGAAIKRGCAMPLVSAPPAGRAERLGLMPAGKGAIPADAMPSRIVNGGHRHQTGAELAGSWYGRPVIVCDLDLATDYGARGDALPGTVPGRFHIADQGGEPALPEARPYDRVDGLSETAGQRPQG
jgi:hypothetical protein